MRNLIFFVFILLFWSCEMQTIEELAQEPDSIQQLQGPYQVTSVSKTTIQSLGKRLEKKTGFNVIESAQMRKLSDFTFDLEASLVNSDTLKRSTYTVPFLEKGDKYSTFNLVIVADSADNFLEQYVLQYEFDSTQYQAFEESQDLLASGVTIKRFPFSSFFNDSNPGFLERCDGIFDSNGDPVTCDEVTLNYGSGYGGGGTVGNTVTITSGGGSGGSSGGGTGGNSGTPCSWSVTKVEVPNCGGDYCQPSNFIDVIVIVCDDPYSRKSFSLPEGAMTCMDCSISNFGVPAFTLTRNATQIDNLLTEFELTQWHMAYLSNNPAFSAEFKALLQSESNLDQKVAMITLTAQMEGVIGSQMTPSFGLAIDDLVEADLSNPVILHLFNTYFSARAAFLKLSNPQKYLKNPNGNPKDPNNINLILYWDTFKEAIHWSLDLAGLVPFLGEPADLLNAGLYLLEGDGVNATISLASTIPVLGTATSGTRMVMKIVATNVHTKKTIRWIVQADGSVSFGSNRLREMFPEILSNQHAHHIIPKEEKILKHPVVQRAARSQHAFHLHERLNGVPVESIRNTNHPDYNTLIYNKLQEINNLRNQSKSDEWFYDQLINLIEEAKVAINSTSAPINNIVF
jgi:hypothetical protein